MAPNLSSRAVKAAQAPEGFALFNSLLSYIDNRFIDKDRFIFCSTIQKVKEDIFNDYPNPEYFHSLSEIPDDLFSNSIKLNVGVNHQPEPESESQYSLRKI